MSDLPIHCLHFQIVGNWQFTLSEATHDHLENCGYTAPDKNRAHFEEPAFQLSEQTSTNWGLRAPNLIENAKGAVIGSWTMVYDEGFEMSAKHAGSEKKLFAFMRYEPRNNTVMPSQSADMADYTSFCDQTRVGWYQSPTTQKYGCWRGNRVETTQGDSLSERMALSYKIGAGKKNKKIHQKYIDTYRLGYVSKIPYANDEALFQPDYSLVETINRDKTSTWKAIIPKQFIGKTMKEMSALLGRNHFAPTFSKGNAKIAVKPAEISLLDITRTQTLPASLDFRNISGVNYMGKVRNQGGCGSCYAFATVDALAARFNYAHRGSSVLMQSNANPANKFTFSPQDVLSCSSQNQGCAGGFPFLVAKYGAETGFLLDKCSPYTGGDDASCDSPKNPSADCTRKRHKVKDYEYIGGFYGACNEDRMMNELQKGPIVVAFDAEADLFHYHSGVYNCPVSVKTDEQVKDENANHHTWQKTTHAVVAVGYGSETMLGTEQKYWIIRNSWGPSWGENGYFKVARGKNTCAVESMAVTAHPVL